MESIVHNLPNNQYHNGEAEREYISSSLLKVYAKSPRAAKYAMEHPQEQTDAMRFGSLFHDCMAALAEGAMLRETLDAIAVFEPPINDRTGLPFGVTTKAYKEVYDAFNAKYKGVLVATATEKETVSQMLKSLLHGCGATSEQVCKILGWGRPEVSIFYVTEEGIKVKIRPDFLTPKKIVDWKTTTLDDLTEESINHAILRYGYHISAAMYQYVYHAVTGKWLEFYLVFVQKQPPYDCVMVNMANYGYRYLPDADIVIPGPGALEFKRLLDLHTKCVKANEWPGAETFIPGDKYRIMEIEPPRYYTNKFIEEY